MRDREHGCIYTYTAYIYTQKHARTHGLSYGVTVVGGMLECGSLSQKHRPLLEGLHFETYISLGARRGAAAPNRTLGRAT